MLTVKVFFWGSFFSSHLSLQGRPRMRKSLRVCTQRETRHPNNALSLMPVVR